MPIQPDPPAKLVAKYDALVALREARGQGAPCAPKGVLAELAGSFPGALRELDRLTPEELTARRRACDAVSRGEAGPEDDLLAAVIGTFHALFREALRLKGDPSLDSDEPELARLVRAPASTRGGRLERVVATLVGQRVGLTPDAVRAVLAPRPSAP